MNRCTLCQGLRKCVRDGHGHWLCLECAGVPVKNPRAEEIEAREQEWKDFDEDEKRREARAEPF